MSLRKMVAITAMYGLGDVLLFGFGYIIIIPVLTRYLSPADYGIVATLTAVSLLFVSVLQLGLPSAAFRYFFLYKNADVQAGYLGSIWLTSLIVTFFLVVIALSFGKGLWTLVIRNAPFELYAKYIVWGAFFQVVIIFKSVLLRAQERPILYVALDVAQFICLLCLIIYNVAVLHQGVIGQVRAVFLTYAVFAAVSAIILFQNVRLRLKWEYINESFRFAGPVLIGYLVTFFASRANIMIVQYLVVGSAIGIFAIGQQLGNLVQLAFTSFEKAWQPFFYRQDITNARLTLIRVLSVIVPAAMSATLAMGLFAPEIIPILTTNAYADAWLVLSATAVGSMFLALSSIVNWGIYYAKRSTVSTFISSVGAVINIGLCLILIPRWGIMGAALASAFSGLSTLFLTICGMKKLFSAPLNYLGLLNAMLLGIAILIIVQLFVTNFSGLPMILLMVLKINALLFYICIVWFLVIKKDKEAFNYILSILRSS